MLKSYLLVSDILLVGVIKGICSHSQSDSYLRIFRTPLSEKGVVILTGVLICSMIIDMELSNVADILQKNISSRLGVCTFIVISGVYLIIQFLLIQHSKQTTADLRARKKDVKLVDSIVSVLQIFIIIIFLLVIAELTLSNSYDISFLIIITLVSNGLTVVTMLFLFKRLFGYFKSHPQGTIFSYAISGLVISITALVTIVFMVPVLALHTHFIYSTTEVVFPNFVHGSVLDVLKLYLLYFIDNLIFISVDKHCCPFDTLFKESRQGEVLGCHDIAFGLLSWPGSCNNISNSVTLCQGGSCFVYFLL